VNAVHPWGIDVSSGVEISPGIKDKNKMNELFGIIKER
jgi:phosphoribosylanthranilate isomerase